MNQPGTSTRRPADRKNQLAAVASGLFGARGFHAVGIGDIATAAGVSGPALYRHFADKQAILAHVLLDAIGRIETITGEALPDPDAATWEQIGALTSAMASRAVERREVAALWRWETRHLDDDARRAMAQRSAIVLDVWARSLRHVRPDLAPSDAALLSEAMLSVFGSVSVHRTVLTRGWSEALLVAIADRVAHAAVPQAAAVTAAAPPVPTTRREQLLATAAALFHERGYHAVSMEDIGAAIGIAGPSVYRYFPGKAALLTSICHRAAAQLAIAADRSLIEATPGDPASALRNLIRSYAQVLTASPELVVGLANGHAHPDDGNRAELIRVQRDYVARWISLLRAARPELTGPEATVTVHAGLTVANDLTRTRRWRTRASLTDDVTALLAAALGVG